jgi:hypothetical protein
VGEIARFYGIIVKMYFEAGRHHRPHLHARAGGSEVAVALDRVEVLAGRLSTRDERLLLASIELHLPSCSSWEFLQSGNPPGKVDPLR